MCREITIALAVAGLLSGCKDDATPTDSSETPSASATASETPALEAHAPTGIADCDAYFEAARACSEKADPALRAQLRESITRYDNQLEQASSEVAKQAVGVGCAAALESLKEEAACP